MSHVKSSTESNIHPYLRAGFILKPENQFWNRDQYKVIDKNGHVDEVLSTSDKGKAYFEDCLKNHKKRIVNRTHNL